MKSVKKILIWFTCTIVILILFFLWMIHIPLPEVDRKIMPSAFTRKQVGQNHYQVDNCWLKKNNAGIWEMYLEGDSYRRGVIYGVLAKELIEEQEKYFVNQINELVPNKIYQLFLKYFVAWFNRNIYKHIPEENLKEIYGVSLSFSDKYDYIGPKYYRILNYHAAHDIGHVLNDFHLVGCTAFSVNKEYSSDSTLLIARNFDFYLGDDFAKQKVLTFIHPDKGYPFASYSWAGFTGVVSGMNKEGVTVTINASESDLPFSSKDPVSLLAREILQYAKNINDAVEIAGNRETFVSESLLIGSAADDKSVLIEKSPTKMDVFASQGNYLICANHYQGETFINDPANIHNITNSDSKLRFDRMNELILSNKPVDYEKAIGILRNKESIGNKIVGLANPKSINQLIAHHAIVFKPSQRKMWISTYPYQLGKFIGYDLNKIFSNDTSYQLASMGVNEDSFINTKAYRNYENFKNTRLKISKYSMLGIPLEMTENEVSEFIKSNPHSYITYMALGDYFKRKKDFKTALWYYIESLKYELGSLNDKNNINRNIEICNTELNNK